MTPTELGLPAMRQATTRDPARPDDPRLIDRYGRVATDLRISLTDRCNLRCSYCMPEEGLDWMDRADQLTDDELIRLIRIAVTDLGVNELRFTGGEPLLRRGLEEIIAASAALDPRPDISLTTNGVGLARRAKALADAGVNRLNVSMDTLRRERFATITHRDRLADVLDGLAAARAAGLEPVKINSVLLRGVNDDEAVDLLRFAIDNGYELRFIEQMPLDAQHSWQRAEMITAGEIMEMLRTAFSLEPDRAERGGAPAERWLVDGGPAAVGVIASVTRPFCGACDRTRLTADGQVRSCLFARTETDLRALVRGGVSDAEIADLWRDAMWGKLPGHGIDDPGFLQPDRPMSSIGG
ncbi:GTP 3',8-cyclase MoaA [Pseudonocardia asaccharolytica]|uniref:GTP 3',8-cyclase n=1 Tax=Pseudonocardia asaccharolytica DSM 44247 = NBRC 16224 TaxID=1123024 RepID=A0A511CWT8_9PSEU|nr:GTP 3',8-cyclase MoaA [Pseudonocardia asaccharolytica]GEL17029.1 cyclic pyranopterin monophosphate synthase [Pseudonocardia asaccharolytica DSM 44247 = NBRC 16224]